MTNFFAQAFDIAELSIENVVTTATQIRVFAASVEQTCACGKCGASLTKVHQKSYREIDDILAFGKRVRITLTVRNFYCPSCRRQTAESFTFVRPGRHQTIRYEEWLYKWLKDSTIEQIKEQTQISWATLQQIFQHYYKSDPDLQTDWLAVRRMAIDEIALKKGHKDFVIVLVDLDTGRILDILYFRTKAKLKAYFLEKGKEFCEKITDFVADFWEGYHTVARELFPNVRIVGDRFHAFGHLQDCVDTCRKAMRKAETTKDLALLKRAKYVLLTNPKNLTNKQKTHLAALREEPLLAELMEVYDLKISFQQIFDKKITRKKAEALLNEWQEKVAALKHEYLKPFCTFFTTWKDSILNYFCDRLTTGIVEGKNNKLKSIKRRAFGFRNFENFRMKAIFDCS